MKSYNQFINEEDTWIKGEDIFEKFNFVIDVRQYTSRLSSTPNDVYAFEINKDKAFDIFSKYGNFNWEKRNLAKNNTWAWEVTIIKIKGYNNISLKIDFLTAGSENLIDRYYSVKDNQITLDEFLDVSIDNIEEYFEMKNNAKKYNL